MLTAERRKYILNILKRDGRIVVSTLSETLDVSIDTVRRDLRDLASEGKLIRVHGGALPTSPAAISYTERQAHLNPEKIAIASRAAQLAQDGMVIVMGGGITNVQIATHFPPDLRATVITHSPPITNVLSEHPGVEVILIGGKLYKYTMVTVGAETVNAFKQIQADLCYLGVCSLHPDAGITNVHYEETQVQRALIACSGEVIAPASSEKLGTAGSYVIGPLSELNLIITDANASKDTLSLYESFGIEIMQV
jgi:DeoR/GlpR family transcriptional regulator of sugar metabolism